MESLFHEVFNISVEIQGNLPNHLMGDLVEVANERLLANPSRLNITGGLLSTAGTGVLIAERWGHLASVN
nr:hypothetical protein [Variovorax sp. E3]